MALMQCPECGKEVSESAEYCVQCGYDLLVYRESQRLTAELEADLLEYAKSIKKPKQIQSLSEINMYRNGDAVSGFMLIAAIISFAVGIAFFLGDSYLGRFPCVLFFIMGVFMLFLYVISIRHDRKLLKKEQAKIQDVIDNFETIKRKKVELHREYLIRENEKKLERLGHRRHNNANSGQSYIGIRCPMCGSVSYDKITTLNRMVSVELVGVASPKIGKQYKCKRCGHLW